MLSYSQTVIPARAQILFEKAKRIVEAIPDGQVWRCHEVARVVHGVLADDRVEVVDGKYGPVEHSWLVISGNEGRPQPIVLDTYAVGQLPQVQLVEFFMGLGSMYQAGPERSDIDLDLVAKTVLEIQQRSFVGQRCPMCGTTDVRATATEIRGDKTALACNVTSCGTRWLVTPDGHLDHNDEMFFPNPVRLSNKACPRYYTRRGPGEGRGCDCPVGRCWYDDQKARRTAGKHALKPQYWRSLVALPIKEDERE
jgi:hypothetical protein